MGSRGRKPRGILRRDVLKAALAAAGASALPARSADKELHLFNWDDYIGETTLEDFGGQFGADVQLSLFGDSDEMFARIWTGTSGFDVCVPTSDYVKRLINAEIILELDHGLIPNIANLSPLHQDPMYDPGNKHSVPYMWGTMGVAYRKSKVPAPASWADVLTAEGLGNSGSVAWISDATSMIAVTALLLGEDMNKLRPRVLEDIFDVLGAAKPHIATVAADNGQDLLAAGEVDMCIEWNGDIAQVMAEDDDIGFVVPSEGSVIWVDCMCVLAKSREPELAHQFINYINDAEVGARIAEYIAYATANNAAYELTSGAYKENEVIFPPEGTNLQTFDYPGERTLGRIYRNWESMLAI